jgi:hypothetical protein
MNLTNVAYFIFLSNLILISSNSLFDFTSFSSGRNIYHKNLNIDIFNNNNNNINNKLYEKKNNFTNFNNPKEKIKVKNKNYERKNLNFNITNITKIKETKKQLKNETKKEKDLFLINKTPTLALVSFFSEELNKTIIDSNIVYWLKSGGANLIIIDQNFPDSKIEKLTKYVNAFVLQDYSTLQGSLSNYEKFVGKLTNKLIEINHPMNNKQMLHKNFLPLFGIGTGANLIQTAVANTTNILKTYKNMKFSNQKVELLGQLKKIRWISHFDKRDYVSFINKTSTFYSSNDFVDYKFYLKNINLRRHLKITGLSKDKNGDNFVAMFEGNKIPFYGISFNPEKIIWKKFPENYSSSNNKEDKKDKEINLNVPIKTNEVITITQKFLNFIINTARKNKNNFEKLRFLNKNYNNKNEKNNQESLKMEDVIDFDFSSFNVFNKNQKEKITDIRIKHHLKEDNDLLKLIENRKKLLKKLFSENDEYFFIDSTIYKKLSIRHKQKIYRRLLKKKQKKIKLAEKYQSEKYQKISKNK